MKINLSRLAVLASILLVPSLAFAQAGSSARLTGQVLDQTGAIMVNVGLDLEDLKTGVRRSTVSNEAGYFSIDVLPPGTYKLTAKSTGFAESVISPIELLVNQTINVSVNMKPG